MEFLRRAAQSIGIGGVERCLSGGGGVRSTYLKTDRSRLFPSDRVVALENFTQIGIWSVVTKRRSCVHHTVLFVRNLPIQWFIRIICKKNCDAGPSSFEELGPSKWSVSFGRGKACLSGPSSLQGSSVQSLEKQQVVLLGYPLCKLLAQLDNPYCLQIKKDEYCPLYKWPAKKYESDQLQQMFWRAVRLEQQKSRNSGSTRSVVALTTWLLFCAAPCQIW